MRSTIRLVALAGALGGMVIGCDSKSGQADAEAKQLLTKAQTGATSGRIAGVEAAAKVADISNPIKVHLHDILGADELTAARVDNAAAAEYAANIVQDLADLNSLVTSVSDVHRVQTNLDKLNPQAAKQSIATKVQELNQGTNGIWIAPLASLEGVKARTADLQSKITAAENQIKSLEGQRTAASTESDNLAKQALVAKGQAAVDLSKQSSGKQKVAMDLATQIEVISASLIPLRQDLEIAQAQEQHRTAAAARFAQQDKLLDQGWNQVQAANTQLADQAKTLATGQADPSIPNAIEALAKDMQEYDRLIASAGDHYDNAVNHFQIAATTAMAINSEMIRQMGLHQGAPEVAAFTSQQYTFTPLAFNLEKADAQQAQAIMLSRHAEVLSHHAQTVEALAEVFKTAELPLPAGVDTNLADAVKTATTKATDAFIKAVETYTTVSTSYAVTPVAKQAKSSGAVALMLTEYAWSQFASAIGDEPTAKSHMDAAIAARAIVQDDPKAQVPTLPPELAQPAASPTTAPTASAAW